jgi:hypothetical protein
MAIFLHMVPANIFGISTPTGSPAELGTFVLHDVQRILYAQNVSQGEVPVPVGYIPATADGSGGIRQLARAPDIRYSSMQSVQGFGASISGPNVVVSYPSLSVLWDGSMQSIAAGTWQTPIPNAGTYSFGVGYMWGLTQFSLRDVNTIPFPTDYLELCTVVINSGTALIGAARVNGSYMKTYGIPAPSSTAIAKGIPVSDQTGTMLW